jgi:hypothetical protein
MGVSVNQAKEPPGTTIVHLMRSFNNDITGLIDDQADMAGGTGWSSDVFAYLPGDGIEVPTLAQSGKYISMFAHFVDLVSRDIRAFMAFGAGVGVPCHFDSELMTGMAGGTSTLAPIWIEASHTLIGPTRKDRKVHIAHGGLSHPDSLYS